MKTFNIGDVIVTGNKVGVVINSDTMKVCNCFGEEETVDKDDCDILMSIDDVLKTFEVTICNLAN